MPHVMLAERRCHHLISEQGNVFHFSEPRGNIAAALGLRHYWWSAVLRWTERGKLVCEGCQSIRLATLYCSAPLPKIAFVLGPPPLTHTLGKMARLWLKRAHGLQVSSPNVFAVLAGHLDDVGMESG